MNRITAIALFAMANLALAGNSFAQDHAVKAHIPFDFTVSNRLLPAGNYTIKSESNHNVIVLRNLDKPIQVLGVAMQDNSAARGDSKLVFSKYGDQYFLRKILCDAADLDLRIPTSKSEQKVRLQEAAVHASGETYVATR